MVDVVDLDAYREPPYGAETGNSEDEKFLIEEGLELLAAKRL